MDPCRYRNRSQTVAEDDHVLECNIVMIFDVTRKTIDVANHVG